MTTNIAFHNAIYSDGFGVVEGSTVVSENITESGSNQQSSAATKRFVTVCATAAIYVAIGTNPNATTATSRMLQPANSARTYGINIGDKVAVVTA